MGFCLTDFGKAVEGQINIKTEKEIKGILRKNLLFFVFLFRLSLLKVMFNLSSRETIYKFQPGNTLF